MSSNRMRSTRTDIALLFTARGVRGLGDGFAIIILPAYLSAIGFDAAQIGIIVSASLFGTALFTLAVGFIAPRHDLRTFLLGGAVLMACTGLAFPSAELFAALGSLRLLVRSTRQPVTWVCLCHWNTPCWPKACLTMSAPARSPDTA